MPPTERKLDDADRGYRLVGDLIHAVEYRLRLPTAWNGTVYLASAPTVFDRAGRSFNGEADPLYDWDAVTVNGDRSLTVRADLLEHALDAEDGRLKPKNNYKAHQSVLRMVHAAVTLSRHERKYDAAEVFREDAASDVLTLGLSQDWAWDHGKQNNTHTVVADLDLNKRAPRMTASRVVDLVPYARTAAAAFVTDLAQAARRPRDVTHRELVSTHPAERWNQIGDWLIDANLEGLIDPEARRELRARLATIARDNYMDVARIPHRLHDMPRNTSVERVQFAAALRDRGDRAGRNTMLRLNMHIKGKQVRWGDRDRELDEAVRRAASELDVPVDKLRQLMESSTQNGDGARGDGTPLHRPASHTRGSQGYDGR
ncbi:MAG: hypothetical protein HOV67_36905 [Kribbellaceae bacterium]|nr:hypothetical protein [Kribbellaceae bacterium]